MTTSWIQTINFSIWSKFLWNIAKTIEFTMKDNATKCSVLLDLALTTRKKTLHRVLTSVRIFSARKATGFYYEIQRTYNIRLINKWWNGKAGRKEEWPNKQCLNGPRWITNTFRTVEDPAEIQTRNLPTVSCFYVKAFGYSVLLFRVLLSFLPKLQASNFY
jgi:hypothetical protein